MFKSELVEKSRECRAVWDHEGQQPWKKLFREEMYHLQSIHTDSLSHPNLYHLNLSQDFIRETAHHYPASEHLISCQDLTLKHMARAPLRMCRVPFTSSSSMPLARACQLKNKPQGFSFWKLGTEPWSSLNNKNKNLSALSEPTIPHKCPAIRSIS